MQGSRFQGARGVAHIKKVSSRVLYVVEGKVLEPKKRIAMEGLARDPELSKLLTEFYARLMQLILESRLPSPACRDGSASTSAHRPAFNLVLGKFASMTDKVVEPWCSNVREPVAIEIFYLRHGVKGAVPQVQNVKERKEQASLKIALEGSELAILLERWTVEFVQPDGGSSSKAKREPGFYLENGILGRYLRGAQNNKYRATSWRDIQRAAVIGKDEHVAMRMYLEKNLAIQLRSLYCTARLLPAHNLSKLLSTTGKGKSKSKLAYRVLTSPSPLSESDKKDMTVFRFPPLDCCSGHLRMSVAYRRTIPMEERKVSSLPPQLIDDYVGKVANHTRERIGHVHSLPSAWCLSSFKPSNLQLHQPASKERALKEGKSWALVQPRDFSLNENETLDCPFAINEEIHNRKDGTKLLSVKSDIGIHERGRQEDASVLAMLMRPSEPLRRTRESLFFSPEPKKTASDALKELKLYIDMKDNLISKRT